MTRNYPIRFVQAFVLAAIVAALVVPTGALGNSSPGKAAPDWFERFAAAHPFGYGVLDTSGGPDVFERYVARHNAELLVDGRSPDTRDAALAARLSRDTRDAAQAAQPIELVYSNRFDWSDAGIGAGMGAAMLALLGGSILVLLTHRRSRIQTT